MLEPARRDILPHETRRLSHTAASTASRRRGIATTPSTRSHDAATVFEGTKDAEQYVDLHEEPVRDVVAQVLLLAT